MNSKILLRIFRGIEKMSQVVAYVLMVTVVGKEHEVIEKLLKINGVSEARTVYGEFDILCVVMQDDLKLLDESITKIRRIESIMRTLTLISG